MPGICGVTSAESEHDLRSGLDRMLGSMTHHEWYRREQQTDGGSGVALGRISLGFTNTTPQPVQHAETRSLAAMDGDIFNVEEVRATLRSAGGDVQNAGQADLLLRGYLSEGPRFFARVDGKFSAALWDGRHRQLVLVNDRFGMKPVFYAQPAGRFVFASEMKALLTDAGVSRAHNHRGIAQFFSFGQLWNEDTFYDGIRALPPAGCVVYDADADAVSLERYWLLPQVTAGAVNRDELLEKINVAFKRSVDLQVQGSDHVGLSLSGGMDSRSILAAIDHEKVRPTCISIGMPGSQDHACAEEMARLAGCKYEQYHLDDRLLGNFEGHLQRMVELTDGHYLSQCIVMPSLPFYRQHGVEVLLRGHAGELFHLNKAYNFSLDRGALQLRNQTELEQWLFDHLRAWILEGFDEPLFACMSPGDVEEHVRDSLRKSLEDSQDWDPPVQRISQIFVTERLRRETAISLVKFNSVTETRVPLLDPELISLVLSAPTELKLDETIQAHILRRQFPAFLKVTNVNTGARVDAGRLARFWGRGKQKVFAKLGVKGYQPYERLGLWLRRELRPLVRSVLLDERCLERGIFRPEAVRNAVEQHFSNERNHTFLLLAMMIFETGQRMFVDREPVAQMQEERANGRHEPAVR